MTEQSSCWVQVTAGRGPAECQRAVSLLVPVMLGDAAKRGLRAGLLETVAGREGGLLLSALLSVSGAAVDEFATDWQGSVQWICKSTLRKGVKRKNWFVGVDVLVPAAPGAARLDEREVRFECFKASGPGGQHVNSTESAVRAIHEPTGLVATAREERSQHMNRKLALARLTTQLATRTADEQQDAERDRWSRHETLVRGQPVKVFEGEAFRPRGG